MDHVEYTYTGGMDRSTVEQRLRDTPTGVLSLADGNDAYAVPVAFHYDEGNTLLLRLSVATESEKMSYLTATDQACFVVYDYTSPLESWSILARGPLHHVTDTDEVTVAELNRRFPALRVFDESIDELEIELYELRIDRITGRKTIEA